MAVVKIGKIGVPPGEVERLRNLLASPKRRAAVSRVLNRESVKVKAICEQVAEESLHRRPDSRRTKESLAHGPEYHDSFHVLTAREVGVDKLKSGVYNDHPAAVKVEKGTNPHPIPASNAPKMIFPFNRKAPAGRNTGLGLGNFPVTGPPLGAAVVVDHPGSAPKRVMARARRRYLDRSRRALNR